MLITPKPLALSSSVVPEPENLDHLQRILETAIKEKVFDAQVFVDKEQQQQATSPHPSRLCRIMVDVVLANDASATDKQEDVLFRACKSALVGRLGLEWIDSIDPDFLILDHKVPDSVTIPSNAATIPPRLASTTTNTSSSSSSRPSSRPTTTQNTTLTVSGMHCPSCAATVEASINNMRGIIPGSVRVSTEPTQTLVFVHDPAVATIAAVTERVEGLGVMVHQVIVARESEKKMLQNLISNDLTRAELHLFGMTWTTCAMNLEAVLASLPGVVRVSAISFPQRAFVAFHASQISLATLCRKVEQMGLEVLFTSCRPYWVDDTRGSREVRSTVVDLPLRQQQQNQQELEDQQIQSQQQNDHLSIKSSKSPTSASTTTTTAIFSVQGMTCASCVAGLESALSALPGVCKVSVSLMTEKASITYIPSAALGPRDIIAAIEAMGFDAMLAPTVGTAAIAQQRHAAESRAMAHNVLGAAALAIPAFCLSMVIGMALPPMHPVRKYFEQELIRGLTLEAALEFVLATPMQFGVGWRFYRGAYAALVYSRSANMDVLVALGTSAAYFYSLASIIFTVVTQTDPTHQYFETSTLLIFFILLGKYLESYAKAKTSFSVTSLLALQSPIAVVVKVDGVGQILDEEEISAELLHVNDLVKVTPGSRIPCDGVIQHGTSSVDESMLTGEPLPKVKRPEDKVTSGTMNLSSLIIIRATHVGSDTALSRIMRLVEDAQTTKAPVQAAADVVSKVFVPAVVLISLATFAVWIVVGTLNPALVPEDTNVLGFALQFAVTVLVVACPCALGLATPTAVMVGTGIAARCGILVKGGGACLEASNYVKAVLFDKTGTLTCGKPTVTDITLCKPTSLPPLFTTISQIYHLITQIESASTHPLAVAVASFASAQAAGCDGLDSGYRISAVEECPGRGMKAEIRSSSVPSLPVFEARVGSKKFVVGSIMDGENVDTERLVHEADRWQDLGMTAVYVGVRIKQGGGNGDGDQTTMVASVSAGLDTVSTFIVVAVLCVTDPPRPTTARAVGAIRNLGIRVIMVTGDNEKTARAVAEAVNIRPEDIFAECLPEQKGRIVDAVRSEARLGDSRAKVAFVGDGINDAVALAKADVGMAIGSGSDVAVESGDVVLLKSDLCDVLTLFRLSRTVISRIYLNLFGAFFYNVIGIPIAAGILYPLLGIMLMPWMAGLAMALSSVTVVVSSLSLLFFHPSSMA